MTSTITFTKISKEDVLEIDYETLIIFHKKDEATNYYQKLKDIGVSRVGTYMYKDSNKNCYVVAVLSYKKSALRQWMDIIDEL